MDYQNNVFQKYDTQVPRYTSYPPVPSWNQKVDQNSWLLHLNEKANEIKSLSLYLHIPFCETLCTFCGCTNIITKNHSKELEYIYLLVKEVDLYLENVPQLKNIPIDLIHLGGGSPSFLSPMNTDLLLGEIKKRFQLLPNFEGSVEVDPRRTKKEHLEVYKKYGFSRISLGVQDFSSEVQRLIHRNQSFEETAFITNTARELQFKSVNFDLIYGLPAQTIETISETIEKTRKLRPNRIALYSFAKVPWIKPQQRLFKDEDLPEGEEKRKLYELAKSKLVEDSYVEIGMDHFALKEDTLKIAQDEGRLYRNFMGYTDKQCQVLLGLGLSSISDTNSLFHQNHKNYSEYENSIQCKSLPTLKGHMLSEEERYASKKILKLLTQFEVQLSENELIRAIPFFKDMLQDHIVEIQDSTLRVTPFGKTFVRNVCTFFDSYYNQPQAGKNLYSKSI